MDNSVWLCSSAATRGPGREFPFRTGVPQFTEQQPSWHWAVRGKSEMSVLGERSG